MPVLEHIVRQELAALASAGLRRELAPVTAVEGTTIQIGDRLFRNFASNDYLGLARHPAVKEAAIRASRDWGAGSAAARLICGSLPSHHDLEEALAAWKQTAAALVFTSGYATALGVIPALVSHHDIVILDRRVHACCVDGARLSGAALRVFRHNDPDSLESILQWADRRRPISKEQRILIVTESVFSMDGDQAYLEKLVELKERYGAWLMLDEAHATGLFGDNRSGLAGATDLQERIEVQMGTLGKALGAAGGYIVGSRALIDFLIHRCRSFLFSTAPVPPATAAARAAVEIVQSAEGASRCDHLWSLARRIASRTQPGMPPASAILPVMIGGETAALEASARLASEGFWVPAIRYPTVRRGAARLRITVSADHSPDDVEELLRRLEGPLDS